MTISEKTSEAEKLLDALLELEPGHWLIPRNAGFKSEDLADLLDQGLIEVASQMGMATCRLISLNEPLVEITPIPGAKHERLYRERDLIAAHEEGAREERERILAAITQRDSELEALGGCGDGGCLVHRPRGQHTNGGCRCYSDKMTMQRYALINNGFAASVRSAISDTASKDNTDNG